MTPEVSWRPAPANIPVDPGVYRFSDAEGRVIYVGKARNLRQRLSSYFQDPSGLHQRTRTMVQSASSVDWTVVGTEVEALQLEYTWIKEYDPRFNVRYRDDKSYPYLAVTVSEEYPRAQVLRGAHRKGVRYFGPFSHAWAIRDTLDQLLRVFPVRTCSAGVFRRAAASGRPCLLGYIDKCSAPCVGRVDAAAHREIVDDLCRFLSGDAQPFIRERQRLMRAAAQSQDYERAARLRDQVAALERALERNAVVLAPGTDADVIAIHDDDLEAAVQVFFVRDGRIRGRRGWVTEKVEDIDRPSLVEHFLQQLYSGAAPDDVPKEILVPQAPPAPDVVEAWLRGLRGGVVEVRVPQRGDKRALLATVEQNATESFVQHRLRRSSDLTTRSQALQELQDALDLPEPPLRIECLDVSHLAGTGIVASLVVFEDGAARRSDYRRFAIKEQEGADDVKAVGEVVGRRFRRYLQEQHDLATATEVEGRRPKAFAYRPQLLVVDGGPAQAQAAHDQLASLGVEGVHVVGLAKRLEEVWPAGSPDPVVLARGSQALYLLQRIRDEAHRVALTYQRTLRKKAVAAGALDQVRGLGPARRSALLSRFGSVKGIRAATDDELLAVPGVGPSLVTAIRDALDDARRHADASAAVNVTTGEIMEQ